MEEELADSQERNDGLHAGMQDLAPYGCEPPVGSAGVTVEGSMW